MLAVLKGIEADQPFHFSSFVINKYKVGDAMGRHSDNNLPGVGESVPAPDFRNAHGRRALAFPLSKLSGVV